MKKNLGFSSFEFYFVVSVIGLILIVGIQRYFKLAEDTRRLSFEILAKNFSAAVYNHHSHWIMAQQSPDKNYQIVVDDSVIQFSLQGWPLAVDVDQSGGENVSLAGCVSLWNTFLQNPPAISSSDEKPSNSRPYHVKLTADKKCRYELMATGFYFEYSPFSGQVKAYTTSIAKNS